MPLKPCENAAICSASGPRSRAGSASLFSAASASARDARPAVNALADVAEALVEPGHLRQHRRGLVVAAQGVDRVVADKRPLDLFPAGGFVFGDPAHHLAELEQVGLGPGGQGLGVLLVAREISVCSSASFITAATRSAMRFMLR